MPTVILLDVSMSMCRTVRSRTTVGGQSDSDFTEIKQLANVGIGTLLDYLAQNAQLESTAFIVFSTLWEIRHQFTRHHESIKNSIYDLDLYDKSNIVNAIRCILSLKLAEWAQTGPVNIILITDGQLYHPSMCKNNELLEGICPSLTDGFHDIPFAEIENHFDFPCKFQIVCLSSPHEPALRHSIPFFKKLISLVDKRSLDPTVVVGTKSRVTKQSAIWLPNSDNLDISLESVEELFSSLADLHYKPYRTTLLCGHLCSMVMLSPKPTEYLLEPLKNEYDDLRKEHSLRETAQETYVSTLNKKRLFRLTDEINICGFMSISEIASPSVISRHLVVPIANSKFNETCKAEQILSQDPNAYNKTIQTCPLYENPVSAGMRAATDSASRSKNQEGEGSRSGRHTTGDVYLEQDITKQPSFSILLHNALKQENMVAICMIGKNDETGEDWFGMLHSSTDNKKRSSLMLSLLTPGSKPVLWLPSFRCMGSAQLNNDLPPAIRDKIANDRGALKSYSSNSVIWLDPESVQADVQKIVRHAKRSPDKAPHFYKELNRIRKAAISYGFYDVLFGLAAILEREKRVMQSDASKPANQEMVIHIDRVVECLRADLTDESYDTNIMPNV